MPDKKLAERLAERRAAIVAEEMAQPETVVSQGQLVPITQLDRPAPVWDILAIAGQLMDYSKVNTVFAFLDRVNPELIIIGDANGPDRMARAWAITRQRQHIEIAAEWEKLGNAAGPLRSQRILDVARKIAIDETKTVALAIFMHQGAINSYPARNIRPILNAAEERNRLYQRVGAAAGAVMPIVFADEWMEEDFLAAQPTGEFGELDLPMPTIRRPMVDVETGEILDNVPDAETLVYEVNDAEVIDTNEVLAS